MSDFSWLANDRMQMALAGIFGGLVRWITLRVGWIDGISAIVVGGICAVYVGPLCFQLIDPVMGNLIVDPAARVGLSGFLIGVGGISVSGFLIDVWKARRALTSNVSKKQSTLDSPDSQRSES